MSFNRAETFELLFDKNNKVAYKALQELQKESAGTDCVYPYMDKLSDMLDSDNSYVRTRGLTLLAYNAKWDKDYKIDEIIDKYLKHITDIKPITARQCIKLLPDVYKRQFVDLPPGTTLHCKLFPTISARQVFRNPAILFQWDSV